MDFVEKYLEKAGIAYEETGENPDYPAWWPGWAAMTLQPDFNGHVDVVPAGDRGLWDFDPFCGTVTDSQILGRGTSDMKAGVAGVLFAMALLKESNVCLKEYTASHCFRRGERRGVRLCVAV